MWRQRVFKTGLIAFFFLLSTASSLFLPSKVFATRSTTVTTSSISSASPTYTKASNLGVSVLTFTLTDTASEGLTQTNLKFTGTDANGASITSDVVIAQDIAAVYLYAGATQYGSATTSSSGVFTISTPALLLSANVSRVITIKIDVASNPRQGDSFTFQIGADQITIGTNTWPDATIGPSNTTTVDVEAPIVVNQSAVQTMDLNSNGYIDAVKITFTNTSAGTPDAIDDSTVNVANFAVGGASGLAFSATTNGDTANNSVIYLTFTDSVLDSGQRPTVAYTPGSLADRAGNTLLSFSWQATDKAPPIALSSVTADSNANGKLDSLVVTMSEDVGSGALTGFSVTGYTVSSASRTASATITINLTEGSSYDTRQTPLITYTPGNLTDTASVANSAASFTLTPTDSAKPIMVSAVTKDTNSNGFLDQIKATFSEDLFGPSVSNSDFTLPGYTVANTSELAGVVTITLTEKTSTDTDQTPLVTVAGNGSSTGVRDLNSNWTNSHSVTPADGASPPNPTLSLSDQTTGSTSTANTVTVNVTISNDSVDVYQYLISESQSTQPSNGAAGWGSKSTTFTLSSTDGSKTVYLWVKDSHGNVNAGTVSFSITLDISPPGTPTMVLWNPENSSNVYDTSSFAQTVITGDINATYWYLSESGTTPLASSSGWQNTRPGVFNFTLEADGYKTLYLWTKNNSGNLSGKASASITIDRTKPIGSISINGNDQQTTSKNVTLYLSASDTYEVTQMKLSNDGTNFNNLQTFATVLPWTLPEGSGSKTVYVIFRDNSGNLSNPYAASSITLTSLINEAPSASKNQVSPKILGVNSLKKFLKAPKQSSSSATNVVTKIPTTEPIVIGGEKNSEQTENRLLWLWILASLTLLAIIIVILSKHRFWKRKNRF